MVSQRRERFVRDRFDRFGCSERFELVGIPDRYHVRVRCRGCGNEFARHTTFLNGSKNHNIECRACGVHADGTSTPPLSENKRGMDESVVVDYYLRGNSASQTAAKFGMNLRRVRRIVDEAGVGRDTQGVLELDGYPDELTGDPWHDEEFECRECGRVFTRRQYMIATGRKYQAVKPPQYCSRKCRTRHGNVNAKVRRKVRRAEERKLVIPLGDLIERDGGVCQLCGGKVDINDGYYDSDGYFHVGRNYPSVDHIIPLAKGGKHSWDNVQLAHQSCNSGKRDRLPDEWVRDG